MKHIALVLVALSWVAAPAANAQKYSRPQVRLAPIYRPPPTIDVFPQVRVFTPPVFVAPRVQVAPPPPPPRAPLPSDWGCNETYVDAQGKIVRRCPD